MIYKFKEKTEVLLKLNKINHIVYSVVKFLFKKIILELFKGCIWFSLKPKFKIKNHLLLRFKM